MTTATPIGRMTYPEYLAFEAAAPSKHEYLCGEVFALAGGTPEHAGLAAAMAAVLARALEDRPCRAFSSDGRVRVEATDLSTYPDISVVCGKLETSGIDQDAIVNPVLLVEILSDSTEAYDRGEKAAHYRRIPSLREYLLVSQRERRLELFRRGEHGEWLLLEAGAGDRLELASIGASIAVDDVYRNPLSAE